MKKIHFIFLFFLLSTQASFSQRSKLDSLLNYYNKAQPDTNKVKVLISIVSEYEYEDTSKAQDYLTEALVLSNKLNYKWGQAKSNLFQGFLFEDKGQYSEALKSYNVSLEIANSFNNKTGISAAANSMGNVFYYLGNYNEALKKYFFVLKTQEEECGEANLKSDQECRYRISGAEINIGNIYINQDNYPEALKMVYAAQKIMVEIGDKKMIATCYINLANIFAAQNKCEEEQLNYSLALKILKDLKDEKLIGACYQNIGIGYSNCGNYSAALPFQIKGMEIANKLNNYVALGASYNNLASTYINLKSFKEAKKYILLSEELSLKYGYKDYLATLYEMYSSVDSAEGNYEGAYEKHKQYIIYRDSLDNEETRKKTIQGQMSYDFEKKEAVATAEHKKELENQEVLSEEKSRKQKVVLALVSGFLLLVVVFAGFIFRSLRITRKQKNIIELQKNLVEQQKKEVELQKHLVDEKQKEVIDSITYARRIQRSLLPTEKYIEKSLNRLNKRI